MDLQAFKESLRAEAVPEGVSAALQALWYEATGEWGTAHELVQAEDNHTGAWVHAYLHRKEGDTANAAYWYRRAGEPMSYVPVEREWEQIVERLLRSA